MLSYTIFPLGDAAATLDLGNHIDQELNFRVRAMQKWFLDHHLEGVKDIVRGYSSLTIHYDPVIIMKTNRQSGFSAFQVIKNKLEECAGQPGSDLAFDPPNLIRIPVCYDEALGNDLRQISKVKEIPIEKIIDLHCGIAYHIHLIGFLPGFPYMATLDDRLNIPRKASPVAVAAGSVGIAGKQTGIYSVPSPGGWHIVGKTPIKLFDPSLGQPVFLQNFTEAEFYPISQEEFQESTWG